MATKDPYLDSETGVLRNLLGLQERRELAEAEADLVSRRAATRVPPDQPTYDLTHLRDIHRWLFQDVYEWAGELRERSDIRKGDTEFFPSSVLLKRTQRILSEITDGPLLNPLVAGEEFVDAISALYLDLNHLHPFREGNGRTQRMFLNDVAAVSGRTIDWDRVGKDANDAASARAVQALSPAPLRRLLEPVIIHATPAPGGALPVSRTSRPLPSQQSLGVGAGVCPLCGRLLRSARSIERGYGPTCWRKVSG